MEQPCAILWSVAAPSSRRPRAERVRETRRRIAEAALELHAAVGPSRTTVSAIAERAGVQRHTYYVHFPEESLLYEACSGIHVERHPLPDPERWLEVADPRERLRRALAELYAYFEAHEALLANVVRDAEVDPLVRASAEQRFAPTFARMRDVLAAGFRARGGRKARLAAAVELVLDFRTWELLCRRRGLTAREAVDLAASMLACL
jgi:AcrR family transcriptional regulator